ncbi:MAG: endo alpha-1,4 polygalactosaminidase [Flavobacteriales bacterium]
MNRIIPITCVLLLACGKTRDVDPQPIMATDSIYRAAMRGFVQDLSVWARSINPQFVVIPQNGQQLATLNGLPDGPLATDYLAAIHGQGREELFFGYDNNDDEPTPADERAVWQPDLELMRDYGIKILVTDYCNTATTVDSSYALNHDLNFISYAADARDLNTIAPYPSPIYAENANDINQLSDAQNFLYLINTDQFETKAELVAAISATNYDVVLLDFFFDEEEYTSAEVLQMKQKANSAQRMVVSYMSIGEAEDYRFYWQPHWSFNPPEWMHGENPDWPGNYKVEYWNEEWQNIIFGNDASYLGKIVSKGFDGVYLDLIDAFEYWEEE